MTKILMIHPQYREYRSELFITLARNFNIDFLFIVGLAKDKIPSDLSNEITYKSLNLKDKRFLPNENGPGLKLIGSLKLFYFLSKELLSTSSNIIITSTENPLHSKISFFWSKILGKKFVIWTETWDIPRKKSVVSKFYQKFSDSFLVNSDAVLVHGTNQKKYCMNIGIPKEKIFIFNHCSADKAKLTFEGTVWEKLHIENKKVILYVGRLFKKKGVEILLKAFRRLETNMDNIFLLIVGTGKYTKYLKNLSNKLEIKNINFFGYLNPNEISSAYSVANVFCLPSYTYNGHGGEGWGLVINEAASMSLPIVTTDAVGSSPDLVKNGYNGFIVKNGNINELFDALKTLLSNDELREKMKSNSRRIFEIFNDLNLAMNNLRKAVEFVDNKK
jgi:glycosyltransferase involved in cell wall biosynthesis